MPIFKKFTFILNHLKEIRVVLANFYQGNFPPPGWVESFRLNVGIDGNGKPIPWYTYSFLSFLENRVSPPTLVFEYGSGNSTLWWASRVKETYSVEHNKMWIEKLKPVIPMNAHLDHCELDEDGKYCRSVQNYGKKFDIIIVDGRDRVNCIKNCLSALSESGVIILDDSHRERYLEAFSFLKERGFLSLSFSGIRPNNLANSSTTVFYRNGNCLSI